MSGTSNSVYELYHEDTDQTVNIYSLNDDTTTISEIFDFVNDRGLETNSMDSNLSLINISGDTEVQSSPYPVSDQAFSTDFNDIGWQEFINAIPSTKSITYFYLFSNEINSSGNYTYYVVIKGLTDTYTTNEGDIRIYGENITLSTDKEYTDTTAIGNQLRNIDNLDCNIYFIFYQNANYINDDIEFIYINSSSLRLEPSDNDTWDIIYYNKHFVTNFQFTISGATLNSVPTEVPSGFDISINDISNVIECSLSDLDGDVLDTLDSSNGLLMNLDLSGDLSFISLTDIEFQGYKYSEGTNEEDLIFYYKDTIAPVITLIGDNPLTIGIDSTYTESGAEAFDNVYGDISDDLVINNNINTSQVGTYEVSYNVSDTKGNVATEVIRTVEVVDDNIPVITLIGDSSVTISLAEEYDDSGATAFDNVDGDITDNIIVTNPVNINAVGTYTISYDVTDDGGNDATTVTREVTVVSSTFKGLPFLDEMVIDDNGSILWDDSDITIGYKGYPYIESDLSLTYTKYYFTFTNYLRLYTNPVGITHFIFDSSYLDTDGSYTTLGVDNSYTTLYDIEQALYQSISYEIIDFDVQTMKDRYISLINYKANTLLFLPPNKTIHGISWVTGDDDGHNSVYYDYTILNAGTTSFYFNFNDKQLTTNEDGSYTFIADSNGDASYTTLSIIEEAITNSNLSLDLDTWTNEYQTLSDYYISLDVDISVEDINTISLFSDKTDLDISVIAITNQGNTLDISDIVVQTGTFDTSVIGLYTITYSINELNYTFTAETVTRNIYVIDDISLVLFGDSSFNMNINEVYTELGFSALNSLQIDVSDQVVINSNLVSNVPGIYTITYTLVDFLGFQIEKTRNIFIFIDPYISFIGHGNDVQLIYTYLSTIYYNSYSAYNSIDQLVDNDQVDVSGNLNTDIIGTYTYTYSFTDEYENEAESKSRTFYVLDHLPPSSTTYITTVKNGIQYNGSFLWENGVDEGYNGAFYDVSFLLNDNNSFYFRFNSIELVKVDGSYEFQFTTSQSEYVSYTPINRIREAIETTTQKVLSANNALLNDIQTRIDNTHSIDSETNNILYDVWTKNMNTNNYNKALSTSSDGNIYVIHYTNGDINGDVTSESETFLTKYDTNGNILWTSLLGSSYIHSWQGITTSSDGNIYITGYTNENLDNIDNKINSGGKDAFLTKYDTNGNRVWTKIISSFDIISYSNGALDTVNNVDQDDVALGGDDEGIGVATSSDGNHIYITGYVSRSIQNRNNQSHIGMKDIFLTKFNINGDIVWTNILGTSNSEQGLGIATSSDGTSHVYITGYTTGDLDGIVNSGEKDVFLSKYDTHGSKLWTTLLGSSLNEEGLGIATASDSSIYITGYTKGTLNDNLNAGNKDIFLSKYDTNGNNTWTTLLGSSGSDEGVGIVTSSDSNSIYITGSSTENIENVSGNKGAFLIKYDINGNKSWTKILGSSEYDKGVGIAITNDIVYIIGTSYNSNLSTFYGFLKKLDRFDDFTKDQVITKANSILENWQTTIPPSSTSFYNLALLSIARQIFADEQDIIQINSQISTIITRDTWNSLGQTLADYVGYYNVKIILNNGKNVFFEINKPYIEYGYIVVDKYANVISTLADITNNINQNEFGTYQVYYDIYNDLYSAKRAIRNVEIGDSTPPIISLNGDGNSINLVIGNIYDDPVTAFDNVDGNITHKILISDNVNVCRVGAYTRQYQVSNLVGNTTYSSRTINIIEDRKCFPYSQDKMNHMSSNMLRSKMIQRKKKFHYNNSKSIYIINRINTKSESINKQLLLKLGKSLYDNYFKRIVQSSSIDVNEKNELLFMYNTIISSLTINDEKTLGIYVQTANEIKTKQTIKINNLIKNPYFTFYCTCINNIYSLSQSSHFIIKNMKLNYHLIPGKKYKFDVSDPTNSGYKMSLSSQKYLFKDVTNIHFIGTPGEPNACVIYIPSVSISLYRLFIYDKLQKSKSSFDQFGFIYETILIEYNYKVDKKNKHFTKYNIKYLNKNSELRAVYLKGPKFFFEDPSILPKGNIFKDRYDNHAQYTLCVGTYVIEHHDKDNPLALITTSENISIHGDISKSSYKYLYGLEDDDSLDDVYVFYYGTIFIDVDGDFGTCGLYSHVYGYNEMENIFTYGINPNHTIIERIQFMEITDVLSLIDEVKQTNPTISISEVEEILYYYDYDTTDYDTSYNAPFNFTSILTQSVPTINYVVKTSFTNLDRLSIYYDSSYLAIDNSFNVTSIDNTNITNYQEFLSSIFHIVEDTTYTGYYRIDSELHSMYSLDISNDIISFNDVWSIYRENNSSYTIFDLTSDSLIPYGRYSYNSTTTTFDFSTSSESSIDCSFYSQDDISLSMPYDFNPNNESYVSNDRVNWETQSITEIDSNSHYNGTTISSISTSYSDQVQSSGNSSYTEAAAISMLTDIVSTANANNFSLRYDISLYLLFRSTLLSSILESNTIVNGILGMNLVPYVYFTNETDDNGDYHPFMVILSYGISDKPNRLLDVAQPPGDGTDTYANSDVTRDATLSDYVIKIPLRDYGEVTNVSDNTLPDSLSTGSNYNYVSTSSIGVAIDGVPIYPVLNNTLTPAQEKAEITNTGIHVGQGLQLHYHADGHGAQQNGLNLYNSLDYSGNSHPPLIGFGYDGIALFGKYDSDYDTMYGYDIDLDDFGGHTHSDDNENDISFGYHYHAHELNASSESLSSSSYSLHILMKGAWKGEIDDIPEFWDTNNNQPSIKTRNTYTGHS
uniref:Pesticidal crystal protein Cry22Aa Ig-like domain-containing protein n=1 Tax=viral metagenome TaxID=1070528 RepID=A0A6C0KLI6_9ZZZZ